MKLSKFVALATLVGALSATAALAQTTSCWEIMTGPGAGTQFIAVGSTVVDVLQGHNGFLALGHFADCECTEHAGHYHGVLFGFPDPDPQGCGWGCIDQVPCDEGQALSDLRNAISNNVTNPAFRAKLNSILDVAHGAVTNQCESLFRGAIDAFGEEFFAGFLGGQFNNTQLDNLIKAFTNFINEALDALEAPVLIQPPKPCAVSLVKRKGSGTNLQRKDAGKKVVADLGSVVCFDAFGCPGPGPYKWSFTFKGSPADEPPSGAGVAFSGQRLCVLSERPASVKITVEFVCSDGSTAKDSITVSFF